MDNWLYNALLVMVILVVLSLAAVFSAMAYRIVADVETCTCSEASE